MKKRMKLCLLAPVLLVPFVGTANKANVVVQAAGETLVVYNWADYIYEGDDTSMVDMFEEYYAQKYGVEIEVKYQTFDTNEIMLSRLEKRGPNEYYDLICPSEYMLYRMIDKDMLERIDHAKIPNVTQYLSPYFQDQFTRVVTSPNDASKSFKLDDYAAGYMWGTMGLVYNPDKLQNVDDMNSWMSLWKAFYKNKVSIKDSMRDTYVVGVFNVFKEALDLAKKMLDEGRIDEQYYNALVSEYFNRYDEDTVNKVERVLKDLKKNIYGFEVDSGKNDVVTGKVAVNLAWSGDAVYSMNTAEEENQTRLYYSVPEEGSNIWFDGWAIPKGAKNINAAHEFINFLADPENAVLNMDYIGYTSVIAGDDVLDYVKDVYHVEDTVNVYDVDLGYFFGNTIADPTEAVITRPLSEKGRQFEAQYPSEEIMNRCAIMKDFGTDGNARILNMWNRVKATELNVAMIIIIALIGVGGVAGLAFFILKKETNKKRRTSRLAQKRR